MEKKNKPEQKVEVKKETKKVVRKSKLSVPFYTKAGVKRGTVSLDPELFGVKPNKKLLAQYVRVYLARQRSAHAKTKSRGEINATKAKVWKQKGTGRARHGARSAPIFVGGGVAHGPRGNGNYKLSLPKKAAKVAFFSALSSKVSGGGILVADIEGIEPKTKTFSTFAKKVVPGKKLCVIHSGDEQLMRAARNIPSVSLVRAGQLSAMQVLKARVLLFTKQGLEALKERKIL